MPEPTFQSTTASLPPLDSGPSTTASPSVMTWWDVDADAMRLLLDAKAVEVKSQLSEATKLADEASIEIGQVARDTVPKLAAYLWLRHLTNPFSKLTDLEVSVWASRTGGLIVAADLHSNASRLTFRIPPNAEGINTSLIVGDDILDRRNLSSLAAIAEAYGMLINSTHKSHDFPETIQTSTPQ